jgi:hypothetical protein
VIDPESKRALITNISQPVYSGSAGPGPHGMGIPTADHFEWAKQTVPWFEASDVDLETAWYFRVYSYHNHINPTGDGGQVVTEFYPHVPWSGKDNTIPCAAGTFALRSRHFARLEIIFRGCATLACLAYLAYLAYLQLSSVWLAVTSSCANSCLPQCALWGSFANCRAPHPRGAVAPRPNSDG